MKFFINKKITWIIASLFLYSNITSGIPKVDSAENEGIRLLIIAETYYRDIDYHKALATFKRAGVYLKAEKNLVKFHLGLSKSYYALNDIENARSELINLFNLDINVKIDREEYPKGYLKIFEEIKSIKKNELAVRGPNVFEKAGNKKSKRNSWFLVIGGTVILAAVIYFLFIKKPKFTLTVTKGEGVNGTPAAGTYTYKKNKQVSYSYTSQPGYSETVVLLDGQQVSSSGSIKMDKDHTLAILAGKLSSVHIESFPTGVDLYIDDINQGLSTPCDLLITAGTHEIKLIKEDYGKAKKNIAFLENKTYSINVHIEGYTYETVVNWNSEGDPSIKNSSFGCITTDHYNNIYTYNESIVKIQKFNPDGKLIIQWGKSGKGRGEFDGPEGIAVDKNNFIYVIDFGNDRILKFDANGRFEKGWGSEGDGNRQFDYPTGIAVDSNNNIFVSDGNNYTIQKFNSHGGFIAKYSTHLPNGPSFSPGGLTIDNNNHIYSVGIGDSPVYKLDQNGRFLKKWEPYKGFGFLSAIEADKSNNIFVPTGSQVEKYDCEGNFITVWDANAGNGIAIDQNGYVYTTNYRPTGIFKYKQSTSETNSDGEWDISTTTATKSALSHIKKNKSSNTKKDSKFIDKNRE